MGAQLLIKAYSAIFSTSPRPKDPLLIPWLIEPIFNPFSLLFFLPSIHLHRPKSRVLIKHGF